MKTKTLTSLLLLFIAAQGLFAQEVAVRNCGTMEHLAHQRELNPYMDNSLQKIEQHTRSVVDNAVNQRVDGLITIPVVVHVIYSNSNENISDAQIQSQIEVLNEDFRRQNGDADNTWSQATDTEIEFCLASVDPSGNATNGITRKSSSTSSWGTNDNMKSSANGGVDAWPTSDYLNMWICNIGGGILGYAQFPGGSAATDGVVMGPQYFGSSAKGSGFYLSAPFDLGRTTTHEVGHWLNLRHIWGDGGCNVDDFVSDTPTSDAANYGCTSSHTSCSSTDMVQNYMDYSDDACMNLYTEGQKARMRALFETGGFRANLLNSAACGAPAEPTCNDGIQNGNETGVDCGGSCADACPSCTDGMMNGDETGVDCGGSCNACPCTGSNVAVSITLDQYGSETTWAITNASGSTVASGGPYNNGTDGLVVSEDLCLADGCYDFTINDAYGDGICCGYGNGAYSVTSGGSLASGGSFASSETTNFCLGGGPAPTCDDGEQNGDETGVDCGGSCDACATCSDGEQNGNETGVDCGGSCNTCPTCSDGEQNGDETGVDCGGSCDACDTGGGPCADVAVNSNNFDSSWGIWNDGGSDCRRSTKDAAYANSGNRCVRLRDNTSTSTMTTDNLDLANFEEVSVDFSYYARSMENNEDFWLQVSTNGGSSYTTVASWARGSDFANDVRYNESVTITGTFSSTTKIRFRCDASGNSDYVYIDDVVLSGCASSARNDGSSSTIITEAMVKETAISLNVYPNPAKDFVNVVYASIDNDVPANLRVFDISGRVVLEQSGLQNNNQMQLDISTLTKGYYIIQVENGVAQETQKLVVF